MAKKVINAFNAGEVSPYVYARTDNELYSSACLKMENFIPLEYGGATRRPSSKYFSTESSKCLLYKFVFNKDNTYLLSFSNLNLNIYRENADIDNTFSDDDTDTVLVATVTTPFAEASLEKLKFVQANNVLFISSEDYPVQILTRDSNDNFELNELEYKYPPITKEIDDISIKADAISGNTTLNASESIFTQDMVGQTIVLKQHRDQVNSYLSEEVGKQNTSSFSNAINVSFANYEIETSGTGWKGKVVVEKSTDGGKSFEPEYVLIDNSSGSENNESTISTKHNITSFATPYAEGANTFIRVHFQSLEAGDSGADGVQIKIKVDDIYIKGVFKILSVPSTTDSSSTAEGVFISPLQDTEVSYSNQSWVGSQEYKRGAKILFAGVFEQDATYSGSDATLNLPSGAGADGNDVIDMTYDYINNAFYFLTNNDKVIRYNYNKANKTLTYVAKRSLTYGDQYTGTATGRGTLNGQSHFGIAFHSDGTYNEKLFVIMRDERSGGNSSGTRQRAKNSRIRIKYFDVFSTDDDQASATDLKVFSSRTNRATYNIHGLSYGNNRFYFKVHESWKTNKYQQAVQRYSVTLDGVVESKLESYQYGKSPKSTSSGTFYTDDYRLMESTDTDKSDIMRRDQMDTIYIDGYLLCLNDADNRLEYRTKSFASTGRKLDLSSQNYFGLAGVPRVNTLKDDFMLKGNVYKIVSIGTHSAGSNFADWTAVTGITYTTGVLEPQVGDTFTAITDGVNGVTFHSGDPDGTFELAPESIDSASSFDLDIIVMSNTSINTSHNPNGSTELQRYKLSGSSDYYQCVKDHTSTNDFITDVDTGYWAKRYPAVTKAELGAFSPANGYPRSISIFENRLCLGGTKQDPNRLWLSQIDDFNNFLTGSLDTEALDLKFNSLTQDEIEWLVPTTKLIIGTSENEWALDSGSPTQALTPTQINLKKQSQYGSNNQQGVLVNSAVLFLMRQGKKLREWYLQENQQDYLAKDLAFIAEHITGDGITQMAVQVQPTTTLWMVRSDGALIGLTYERETNTFAWHRHLFDGRVESVAVLPKLNGEDEIFLSVKRSNSTSRDIIKLDPYDWGYNYQIDYSGLDFYKKYELNGDAQAVENAEIELTNIPAGTYTANQDFGAWRINIDTNDPNDPNDTTTGFVTISGTNHKTFRIHGSPAEYEVAGLINDDLLVHGKTYELVYQVVATDINEMLLRGKPATDDGTETGNVITPDGYLGIQGQWMRLPTATGTYTLRFRAQQDDTSDGDPLALWFYRKGGGTPTGTDQTLKLISLKDVSFDGLEYLEGRSVTVVRDGERLASTYTVSNGNIYPISDTVNTSGTYYVGLPYTSTLAPLYIDAQGTQGSKKSIQHAVIRFKDTLKAKVGQKETGTYGDSFTSVLDNVKFGSTTALNTEDAEVWLANHNEFLQTVYVVQDEPSPCTVLAMVVDVEGV